MYVVVVVVVMAICWSFAMVLVLTLTTLVVPTQPLFHPQPARPHRLQVRENPKAAIEQGIPLAGSVGNTDVERSWNVLVGRRGRFRRLFQLGNHYVCDAQLKCQRNNKNNNNNNYNVSTRPPLDLERSQTRAILDNYRLPPNHSTHFESDRMVPTGPNPLHNSNRSQVILP